MLVRAAWHTPRVLSEASPQFWPGAPIFENVMVIYALVAHDQKEIVKGVPLRAIVHPILGLLSGQIGARR